MKLRAYQNEAVSAAYAALSLKKNPVLQLATGTGKSLIIAELAKLYKAEGKRVWILTHVLLRNSKLYFWFFFGPRIDRDRTYLYFIVEKKAKYQNHFAGGYFESAFDASCKTFVKKQD